MLAFTFTNEYLRSHSQSSCEVQEEEPLLEDSLLEESDSDESLLEDEDESDGSDTFSDCFCSI